MTAPQLKPCPFCGGSKVDGGYNEFGGFVSICANCEASGPPASEKSLEAIIDAWNARADLCQPTPDAATIRADALREAVQIMREIRPRLKRAPFDLFRRFDDFLAKHGEAIEKDTK